MSNAFCVAFELPDYTRRVVFVIVRKDTRGIFIESRNTWLRKEALCFQAALTCLLQAPKFHVTPPSVPRVLLLWFLVTRRLSSNSDSIGRPPVNVLTATSDRVYELHLHFLGNCGTYIKGLFSVEEISFIFFYVIY